MIPLDFVIVERKNNNYRVVFAHRVLEFPQTCAADALKKKTKKTKPKNPWHQDTAVCACSLPEAIPVSLEYC